METSLAALVIAYNIIFSRNRVIDALVDDLGRLFFFLL